MSHEFTLSYIEKFVKLPVIAWPTVFLVVICVIADLSAVYLLLTEHISKYTACLINTIAIYALFTPMHDAAHGSVGYKQYRWLNDVVGHIAGAAFPVPFPALRHIHLQHHKYTNQENDPDLWTSLGPWYLLPLRWYTIEFNYYYIYLSKINKRPFKESSQVLATLAFFIAFISFAVYRGYGEVVFWAWILPGRNAVALLALFFDYLPHRPHSHNNEQDIYKATSVTSLYGKETFWLTWPLLYQNYHNIHHLIPFIPFYYYSTVWFNVKDILVERGTNIIPIVGSAVPSHETRKGR
jgi:fatty acid desaturase